MLSKPNSTAPAVIPAPSAIRRLRPAALCLLAAALGTPAGLRAQFGTSFAAPVTYTVTFPNRSAHFARVEAQFPTAGQASVRLTMALWTPGEYRAEHYADRVDSLTAWAPDGSALYVTRTGQNQWQLETGGAPTVTVGYRVQANRTSLTGNWVGDTVIVLNGAPTFLKLDDGQPHPAIVDLTLPIGWISMTPLDTASDGVNDHYRAADYDELIDSPIVAGYLQTVQFDLAGRTHMLVDAGAVGEFSGEQAGRALLRVVGESYRFWGFLPYRRYLFLNVFRPGNESLAHANSSLIAANAKSTESPDGFAAWLTRATRDYFQAFNGKRLRPVVTNPFDATQPPATPSLWISDGLSTYYSHLLLARAGLLRQRDWLERMSGLIARLQNAPGRRVQSLAGASLDAWATPAPGTKVDPSKRVDYDTKGAVVGLLLDAHIRTLTNDSASLDDVLRRAYALYPVAQGYTPEQFQAVADSVAHTDLTDWFHAAVDGTDELDYQEMLDWFGLQFAGGSSRTARWDLRIVDKPTPEQEDHLKTILLPDAQQNAPTVPVVPPRAKPDSGGGHRQPAGPAHP